MRRIKDLLKEYRMGDILDDCGGVNLLHGLNQLIHENLNKDSVICEIGSYEGKSSELFALLCKEVYCVDVFYDQRATKIFDDMIRNYSNIWKIEKLSSLASKEFPNNFFDFIYIDANHDYDSVKQDIINWIDKIKIDGYVGGHDYHQGSGGVYEATQELFKDKDLKIYPDSSWILKIN